MKYFFFIIGSALVTYFPRFIPLMLIPKGKLNERIRLFLLFIPYTSLSILMIRGVFTASQDMKIPTIMGVIAASVVSYIQKNIVFSVLAGIMVAFITIKLFS